MANSLQLSLPTTASGQDAVINGVANVLRDIERNVDALEQRVGWLRTERETEAFLAAASAQLERPRARWGRGSRARRSAFHAFVCSSGVCRRVHFSARIGSGRRVSIAQRVLHPGDA